MGYHGKSWESMESDSNRMGKSKLVTMLASFYQSTRGTPSRALIFTNFSHSVDLSDENGCLDRIVNSGRPGVPAAGRGVLGIRGKRRQTACKPGSVPALAGGWRPFIWDARCRTPHATDPDGDAETRFVPFAGDSAVPIWSCSRWGLPCRFRCRSRGALLPHPFTLAGCRAEAREQAVCFLWHFPWGRPRRTLSGTVFPWSPDFPPPRSLERAVARPSDAVPL